MEKDKLPEVNQYKIFTFLHFQLTRNTRPFHNFEPLDVILVYYNNHTQL